MDVKDLLKHARVTGRRTLTPDSEGVLRLASNIGYSIPQSLADIVDNSIDAGAKNVLIRIHQQDRRLDHISIVDDGSGMDSETLVEAMRLGTSSKGSGKLGVYGIGLKAASLSHTQTLSVASRQAGAWRSGTP